MKAEILDTIKTDYPPQPPTQADDAEAEQVDNAGHWNTVTGRRAPVLRNIIQEEMAEQNEIAKRKNNLILVGVKESAEAGEELRKIQDLIRVKLGITEEIVIQDYVRLGTRNAATRRMLKFTVRDLKMKKQILSKATTLRHLEEDDEFHKVFIKPDLTPIQTEASKNLVAQLKLTREREPTKKFKIFRGRIIELNPDGTPKPQENHI